jgi:hypothetical protein
MQRMPSCPRPSVSRRHKTLERRTVRIIVRLTVDVDPQRWAEANGADDTPPSNATVNDIRQHLLTLAQGAALIDESGATVELTK